MNIIYTNNLILISKYDIRQILWHILVEYMSVFCLILSKYWILMEYLHVWCSICLICLCLILSVLDKYWHILISICQYLSNTVSIRQILTYILSVYVSICLILSVLDKYWHIYWWVYVSICLILSVLDKYWHILMSICQYLSNIVSIRQILTYTHTVYVSICSILSVLDIILSVLDKYWHILDQYMSVFV